MNKWLTKKIGETQWVSCLFIVSLFLWVGYLDFLSTSFIKSILSYFVSLNLSPNLVAIISAIIGWLVALWMQNKNIKQQLKTEIKYDIYKQFVILHKENQDTLANLMAKINPPFILMESSMIPFELKLKKEHRGEWIPHNEIECVFDGEKKWSLFINELNKSYFDFSDKNIAISYLLEDWMAPIKNLYSAKEKLVAETEKIKKQILKNISALQMYSTDNGYDWRKWDRIKIEEITKNINNDTYNIICYLHDFMVLVHNELLSKYFRYSRPIRKTLDTKYKVLTKEGFVVRLETDKERIDEYNKVIKENAKNETKR